MRRRRCHHPGPLAVGAELFLEERATRHFLKVLRLGPGARLELFNGDGFDYQAEILSAERHRLQVGIGSRHPALPPSPLQLAVGVALLANDRFKWCLQKLNEIGAAELTPLATEYTEVRLSGEQTTRRLAQWRELVVNSSEQCGRNQPMRIHAPAPLADWLQERATDGGLLLQPGAGPLMRQQSAREANEIVLCSGPEGGFSEREAAVAAECGFKAASIGPRILRAETAPLVAATLLQAVRGDLA